MALPNTKLPGVQFAVKSPSFGTLPRMDVAVMVGFAAAGPLDVPVAIETPARFAEIFGPDLQLAWVASRGEWLSAHLGSAVRAFFQNGGKRCWVIRVAGASAKANRFVLPGLQRWTQAASSAATLEARSEGSWSDRLSVAATLQATPVSIARAHIKAWLSRSTALRVDAIARRALQDGDVLRITLRDPISTVRRVEGYLAISELTSVFGLARPDVGASFIQAAVAPRWFDVELASDGRVRHAPRSAPVVLRDEQSVQVERLNLELWAKQPAGAPVRLRDLGMHALHPRYWRAMPSDQQAFQRDAAEGFGASVLDPRFPLAGTAWAGLDNEPDLPLGLTATPSYVYAEPSLEARAERDGVATFDPGVFLDARLADLLPGELLGVAERLHSTAAPPLRGLHAACLLEDATLICAPDALHRSWSPAPSQVDAGVTVGSTTQAPEAPELDANGCKCQSAALPACADLTTGPGAFRARAAGPSAPQLVRVHSEQSPPGEHQPADSVRLVWSDLASPAEPVAERVYELEEASRPDWSDAVVRYNGTEHTIVLYGVLPGVRRYRVRALDGNVAGEWSEAVVVNVTGPVLLVVSEKQEDFSPLLRVQRALLRLCAARGDLVATLALPDGTREKGALEHVTRLRTYRDLGADRTVLPQECLSYACVVHPWLMAADRSGSRQLQRTPADGAMLGLMAGVALERGAWIAPATRAFQQVLGLTPAISPDNYQALLEHGINVIQQSASGFCLLCAETLSVDIELQPLNVRRLLTLLRRLALERGHAYVFEPHDATLRREVEATFNTLLADLFARGAFAGADAESAYRVVVDVGPGATRGDEARLLVQLQVAPSLPLTFIEVVLEQKATGTQIREVA